MQSSRNDVDHNRRIVWLIIKQPYWGQASGINMSPLKGSHRTYQSTQFTQIIYMMYKLVNISWLVDVYNNPVSVSLHFKCTMYVEKSMYSHVYWNKSSLQQPYVATRVSWTDILHVCNLFTYFPVTVHN
jgi:hypothetical protein